MTPGKRTAAHLVYNFSSPVIVELFLCEETLELQQWKEPQNTGPGFYRQAYST
jgi:hypothetical protein